MTPREAVDIYRKNVKENYKIDFLNQTKNYFVFLTEKDRSPERTPSYYVNKNTGKLIDGFKPSPESGKAWEELADIIGAPPIPASEYL
ncbi:MAG: hypothetical protein GX945_13260 [Lentisphaerae bacterium]|nr:hypothetical protein [Lentisphaerota bacterium]